MKKNTERNERAIDRLKIFAEYAKVELKTIKSFNSFESYCGLSHGYINSSDKGGRSKGNISSDIIAKISEAFPMLNVKWLCNGKGEMIDGKQVAECKLEAIKKILE